MAKIDLKNSASNLDQLVDKYIHMIEYQMKKHDPEFFQNLTLDVLAMLLGELADNVSQHSNANYAYLFGQFWPGKQYFEFCILDDGRGVYESLKSAGREVEDNFDAIRQVIESHLSAKDVPGEYKRGTGIKNTRKLLNNDLLKGDFIIVSNDTGYIESNSQNAYRQYIKLTKPVFYGAMVVCRLSKPKIRMKWTDYVSN